MRAGALRHRVRIQARSTVQDAAGGQDIAWTDIAERWCQIEPSGGKEVESGDAVRAITSHNATMRYHPQILSKNRLLGLAPETMQGRIFNIVNVNNVKEQNRELNITLNEGLNDG